MKALLRQTLQWALEQEPVRRRLVLELRQRFFDELEIAVPLNHELVCPIVHPDYWHSFQEIFFRGEYRLLNNVPLPTRWLDLGCHAGFFSLYLLWRRAEAALSGEARALLIDGDSRVQKAVSKLIDLNGLVNAFRFVDGAISSGTEDLLFSEREVMASSMASVRQSQASLRKVRVVPEREILELLPPPYDLVKIDVEGSEYDFLKSYREVLKQTAALLMEWHSWHAGGGGRIQLMELALGAGFQVMAESIPPVPLPIKGGAPLQCGVVLFVRPQFRV